jgi:TatA/E family protein of Tat protein translocase
VVNVGPLELVLVLIIALIVLGPARLPEVARSVGRGMREFRSALASVGDDRDDDDQDHDDEIPELDEPPALDEPPELDEPPALPAEPPGGDEDAEPAPGTPEDLPERG